jgi:hypothetical protein
VDYLFQLLVMMEYVITDRIYLKLQHLPLLDYAVTAGTKLGEVGNTGSARGTAPHLHFGISWPTEKNIWWVRRGVLYPWKFLDAWKIGKDLSPANSINAVKLKMGELPPMPKNKTRHFWRVLKFSS